MSVVRPTDLRRQLVVRSNAEFDPSVPRYFFDSEVNGRHLDDEDGVELENVEAARREGVVTLCAMAAEHDHTGQIHVAFNVRDERQTVMVLEMDLKVSLRG